MTVSDRGAARHPMGAVTKRTGLTADVIRAWERRYGVVTPGRSAGGHRLYSDSDVERLRVLHRLTLAGRQIGKVADLSDHELTELLREDEAASATAPGRRDPEPEVAAAFLGQALEHVEGLDSRGLDRTLRRAALNLSTTAFLDSLLSPLLTRIGDLWEDGSISPAHEHLASAVAARLAGWLLEGFRAPAGAPCVLVSTPAGQRHELGALSAGVAGAAEGWQVRYLGPNLPAADIGRAALETGALVVALSVVYPSGDPATARELAALSEALPKNVAMVVGGAAASSYAKALEDAGAVRLDSFQELRAYLRRLAD